VGKILKTINLVVGAIKPKKVTWGLNKNGTGYEIISDGMDNHFGTFQSSYTSIEAVKKEKQDVYEQFLTASGIPWIEPTVKSKSKSGSNLPEKEDPKFSREALKFLHQSNLETKKSMQESIDLKTRMIKNTAKKSKKEVIDVVYCSFTPIELAREKKADVETVRRLKEMIESKSKINNDIKPSKFTTEELSSEKKADLELQKRLKERITEHTRTENARLKEARSKNETVVKQMKEKQTLISGELEKARSEKEKIVKQMKEKQALISGELEKEKENLEKARKEKETIVKQMKEKLERRGYDLY